MRFLIESLYLTVIVMILTGCGGSSRSGSGGSPPDDPGGAPVSPRSCQERFTPERVIAGENCDPALNRFMSCPSIPGADFTRSRSEVIPCSGVSVSRHTATGGGFSSEYLAIRPSSGITPDAIYIALHYLGASTEYFANLIRLSELAKLRNVLVIAPQAPGVVSSLPLPEGLPNPFPETPGVLVSRWPTSTAQPIENYLQLLDGVIADVRSRFGAQAATLYLAGLSNGAPMAYFYACGRANQVEAILSVAGRQSNDGMAACQLARPVGLVIVHGTLDPVVPYNGLPLLTASIRDAYEQFRGLNQCAGADQRAVLAGEASTVEIDFTAPCAGARRVVLASSIGNGHNWPGDDIAPLLGVDLDVGIYGPSLDDIDSTIQGYDLMRYAAGN